MAEITAGMVKELREATGLGMMECKKALTEAGGDMKKAEELLRIKSGAKASKVAGRVAAEGVVGVHIAPTARPARWSKSIAKPTSLPRMRISRRSSKPLPQTAADERRRRCRRAAQDAGQRTVNTVGRHAQGAGHEARREHQRAPLRARRRQGQARLSICTAARSACWSITRAATSSSARTSRCTSRRASRYALSGDQVPPDAIATERRIYSAQAQESGKPDNIVAKMVEGRVAKFLTEVTLLGQPFVKDPDKQTIEKLLKAKEREGACIPHVRRRRRYREEKGRLRRRGDGAGRETPDNGRRSRPTNAFCSNSAAKR